MASWREVVAFSQALNYVIESDEEILATPMRSAHVIRLNENGERVAVPMRWGFPDWGTRDYRRPQHMHARCETIDTLPTFKEDFALRRGIVLTHTFNEGEEVGRRTKQWRIKRKDQRPTPVAVIYHEHRLADGTQRFFVMVTTPANAFVQANTKQDRMPAIMPPEDWPVWLGEVRAPLEEVKALLRMREYEGEWDMTPEKPEALKKERPPPPPGLFD